MKATHCALFAAALIAVASCTSPSDSALGALDDLPKPTTTMTTTTTTTEPSDKTTTTTTEPPTPCEAQGLATHSYRPHGPLPPAGQLPADPFLQQILQDRVIRVGVDEHTLGFSFRDPMSGEYDGFEVALAEQLVLRIFGPAVEVEPVPLVTGEKFDFVEDGRVDMTVSANTMSCDRWEQVAFSAEYFTAVQQFLVRQDSPIAELEDADLEVLDGQTVCVTERSSSARIMREHVLPFHDVTLLEVPSRPDCLVALQTDEAAAYFSHDSFLYGMLVADPTMTIVLDLLPRDVTTSHYGIAIADDNEEFVRLVNAALQEIGADGTWADLHGTYLGPLGIELPEHPPQPQYRD